MNSETRNLAELSQTEVKYLSKWVVLDKNKLYTIKSDKLYAGFSSQFNDVFDSQIRLDTKSKEEVLQFAVSGFDYKAQDIDFVLEDLLNQLHYTHLACFSECDPLSLSSNHMWGLYGASGSSIGLQYNVNKLNDWFKTFTQDNSTYEAQFFDIAYYQRQEQYNRKRAIEYLLKLYINNCNNIPTNDIKNKVRTTIKNLHFWLLSTKSHEWQFEKEWRFSCMKRDILQPQGWLLNDICYIKDHYYLNNDLNHDKMKFNFIKPDKIIFGWKVSITDGVYKELNDWAKEQKIETIYLDTTINYENGMFNKK